MEPQSSTPGDSPQPQPKPRPLRSRNSGDAELKQVSPWLLRGFHRIARRRLQSAFRGVRLAGAERAQGLEREALVVMLNHPSWWDPLVGFVLARHLFGQRDFYAPMDAAALQRYGIFRRLGMFPVQMQSPRGAAQFLRAGQAVLRGGNILAVTPQGQFTDARERPVRLQPGLAALLRARQQAGLATCVLPIAVEYSFWDQRLPEVLALCGEPLRFGAEPAAQQSHYPERAELQAALELGLQRAQDELARLSLCRDARAFATLVEGRSGSAGWYGWIERLGARLRGAQAPGDHTAGTRHLR